MSPIIHDMLFNETNTTSPDLLLSGKSNIAVATSKSVLSDCKGFEPRKETRPTVCLQATSL